MPDEKDDQITLRANTPAGDKEAAEDLTLFDKTSYSEDDQVKDPLHVEFNTLGGSDIVRSR